MLFSAPQVALNNIGEARPADVVQRHAGTWIVGPRTASPRRGPPILLSATRVALNNIGEARPADVVQRHPDTWTGPRTTSEKRGARGRVMPHQRGETHDVHVGETADRQTILLYC